MMPTFWQNEPKSAFWPNEPEAFGVTRDCFAEPVIGPAKGRTRWLAMMLKGPMEYQRHCESTQRDDAISATRTQGGFGETNPRGDSK